MPSRYYVAGQLARNADLRVKLHPISVTVSSFHGRHDIALDDISMHLVDQCLYGHHPTWPDRSQDRYADPFSCPGSKLIRLLMIDPMWKVSYKQKDSDVEAWAHASLSCCSITDERWDRQ